MHGKGRLLQYRLQQPLELRAERLELLPAVLGGQHIERGDAARHGHGIAGKSARLISVAVGCEPRHDPPRSGEGPHRHAAADHLAEGGEVGDETQLLGGAAAGEAKAGDDFVEDEQRAALASERAQPLEELPPLRQQAVIRGHAAR